MILRLLGVAYAILFVAIAPLHEVQASFTPISSSLTLNGSSNLSSTSSTNPGRAIFDSQSTTVDPLSVHYTRTLDNGVETLTETGVASATWSDPSSGSVEFDLNLSSADLVDGVLSFSKGSGFSYSFTASTDGLFTFGGSLSSTAPSPGLRGGVIFQFADLGGYLTSGQIDVSGATSRFISQTLVAGQDYFLEFLPSMQVWCGLDLSCDLLNRNETLAADLSFGFESAPADLSGTIKAIDGTDICAMVLASGQYMFSCDPAGVYSLTDLPRQSNGTVKRQIYADGFLPKIDTLPDSTNEAVTMTRSGTCPSYNTPYDPAFVPDSAGTRTNIVGQVLLQNSQTPICAMVLANGQYMFSCDGTGSYALNIPLDTNGQFKLQVYADGFAPTIQTFDEFQAMNDVRMARAMECQ